MARARGGARRAPAPATAGMTDDELLRWSRHILLDEIGIEGQERIRAARALVIGAGGLGSPVALYLGSSGIGRLTLVDDDVVVDCTDNFATRQAINAACVAAAVPLVSGAAIAFDGQVSTWDTRRADAPCYACAFPPAAAPPETRCATMGVFAPLVGIIGALQAAEALKLVAGVGESLAGRLQMFDARGMDWTTIRVPRDRACPVCASRAGG